MKNITIIKGFLVTRKAGRTNEEGEIKLERNERVEEFDKDWFY